MIRFIPTSLATLALILIGTLGVPQKSLALVPSNGKWHTIYHVQVKHKSQDSWRSITQFDSRPSADRHVAGLFSTFFAVRVHEDRVFRQSPHTNVGPFQQHNIQHQTFQNRLFQFNQHHDHQHNQHHDQHHDQHRQVHQNQQHQQHQQQFNSRSSSQSQQQSSSKKK